MADDPYPFPGRLLQAQCRLQQITAALHQVLGTLPWSREPHDGFPEEERSHGRPPVSRPATAGWPAKEAVEVDRLRARQRRLAIFVTTHPFWGGYQGEDLVRARMALKHHQTPAAGPA